MSERYAIYYAPPADSECWRLGTAWLGHDPERAVDLPRPAIDGLDAETAERITRAPRHYGFHATLKPPFALADGATPESLCEALAAFAAERSVFVLPALRVADLNGFLALVPRERDPRLDELAADCVRCFDRFRAPPAPAELARRRAAGLTARQEENLAAWGYPYVLEEFRFHMTLTERLADFERPAVQDALAHCFAGVCARPLRVEGIALFRQPESGAPFRLEARFAFAR